MSYHTPISSRHDPPGQPCAQRAHEDRLIWNLYQQISLLGADVTVIRNDTISPDVFPQLQIDTLIIPPDPGYPTTDSGISLLRYQLLLSRHCT